MGGDEHNEPWKTCPKEEEDNPKICWIEAAKKKCAGNPTIDEDMTKEALEKDPDNVNIEKGLYEIWKELNPEKPPCKGKETPEEPVEDQPWNNCPDPDQNGDNPENCWIRAAKAKCQGNEEIGDDMIVIAMEKDPKDMKSK